MISENVTITNLTGMNVTAAGRFCDTAIKFENCHIMFKYGTYEANAKSMLSVLGSGVRGGDTIEITCDGLEEKEALEALVNLVKSDFM